MSFVLVAVTTLRSTVELTLLTEEKYYYEINFKGSVDLDELEPLLFTAQYQGEIKSRSMRESEV